MIMKAKLEPIIEVKHHVKLILYVEIIWQHKEG